MKANNLFEFLHQGFRITVGATASLVETLQDPQKRQATFSELQTEFNQRTEEWLQKGEQTEEEARRIVNQFWQKQGQQSSSSRTATSSEPAPSSTSATPSTPQTEIQELTEQIVTLRKELEELGQG